MNLRHFPLTDSPACLVADEHDLSGNSARMLKAAGQAAPESKPILEANPDHAGTKAEIRRSQIQLVTHRSTRPCWPKAVPGRP
jgi:HSP90 family molecular chaperone